MTSREQMTKDAEESEKAFKQSIDAMNTRMLKNDRQRQEGLESQKKNI